MNTHNKQTQAGVTLVFSLVILLTLTMLAITSLQSARTEISLAANLREASLTFNAAEAGQRAGQGFVDDSISKTTYSDPTTGLYDLTDLDPDYGDPTIWTASQDTGLNLEGSIASPRFIVKYLGDRSQNELASPNVGGYSTSQAGITVSYFRITSQGIGQSGNLRRYIQSYFGREY